MDPDSHLCHCFRIKKRKIVNFVRQTRPRRASQISECFGAGTGCGWCIPFLKEIHRQIVAGEIVESGDIAPGTYEAMRREYLEAVRTGARARNTLGSPPDRARDDGRRTSLPDPRKDPDGGWDVSDYFSRPPRPDPEPDDMTGRTGSGPS